MPKVAIIEDNIETSNAYAAALMDVGIETDQLLDVDNARKKIQENQYDAYLLDLDLDDIKYDGLSLVPYMQKNYNYDDTIGQTTPILIVSGHPPQDYKAISQKFFTAWDHISKPVELDDLVSMVRLLLKFSKDQKSKKPSITNRLLLKNTEAYWDGKKVPGLSMIPYKFLQCLVDNIGEPITFNELYKLTNGYERDFQKINTAVRVHIRRLRISFKEVDSRFDCIQSVRSKGYEWVDDTSSKEN